MSAQHVLQDIEAVDPEYYKNLKWMLENNITDVLDLTFTEESDYFGKKELVELKPGGKDIRSALHLSPLHPALGERGKGGGVAIGDWDCSSVLCVLHSGRMYCCLGLLPLLFSISLVPCICRPIAWQCFLYCFFLHAVCPASVSACAEQFCGNDIGCRSVNMGEGASIL